MCTNPKTIKQKNGDYILVPCGECIECIKDKQNDTAVMCVREAEKCGCMTFVTLTYSNEHIPMYFNIVDIDEEQGEMSWNPTPTRLPADLEDQWRKTYFSDNPRRACWEFEMAHCDDEDYDYIVTPSVCREDVRLWIKRSRINYKRHHGEDLDFKYVVCGEYGTNTGRPHFHIGIFGLTRQQVWEICEDWKKNYGHVDIDQVVRFDGNPGVDHYEATAKYIGKYISKGEFESPAVKEGRAEKPRKMTSIDFGIKEDTEALKRYHYCFDLVGEYNPDDLSTLHLTQEQYRDLLDEIYKRKKYSLNGKDYKLPRKLQRKLFYKPVKETDPCGEVKRTERSLAIYRLASLFIRNRFNKDFAAELQQARDQYGDEVPYSVIREIVHRENVNRQARAQVKFKAMHDSYKKSWF